MILIAEPVHFSEVHVQVNSAFIALYRHIFAGEELQVYAEEQHIQAIRNNCGPGRVEDVVFTGFKAYGGPWYWPGKIWGEWRQILKVVRLARRQKPEWLIWLCLFPTGNLFLQLLSRLLIPAQKQVVILHGELEYLAPAPAAARSERFLAGVLRRALSMAGSKFRFIVLGTGIPARLNTAGISIKAPVYGIDHPFLYPEAPVAKRLQQDRPLQVCTFGTLKRSKNAHLFFELAGRFQQEIAAGQIRFRAIGKLFPDMAGCSRDWVECPAAEEFLPRETYEQLIRENDLVLFFYDGYRLSASGALGEALYLQLPVWSLYNDYFNDLFSRFPVGLCLSVDEMESRLRRMLESGVADALQDCRDDLITFFQENTFLLQADRLKSVTEKQ